MRVECDLQKIGIVVEHGVNQRYGIIRQCVVPFLLSDTLLIWIIFSIRPEHRSNCIRKAILSEFVARMPDT